MNVILEYLLSNAMSITAKKAINAFFGKELQRRLRDEAEEWRNILPEGSELLSIEALLIHRNSDLLPDAPGAEPILKKLEQYEIPSRDDWCDSLMHRWERLAKVQPAPQAFFTIPRDDAQHLLRQLSDRLYRECAKDKDHFQVEQLKRSDELNESIAELTAKVDAIAPIEFREHVMAAARVPHPKSGSAFPLAVETSPPASAFHAEIDAAVAYTQQGKPDVAIAQLERLRRERWDVLSPRERFRVVANIGHAHDRKGDYSTAAKFFVECVQYQPDDEKARAYFALGLHISGDDEPAFEAATKLCADFPRSDLAWPAFVRSAPQTTSFDDLEATIPPDVRNEIETCIALGTRARGIGNLDKALSYARHAYEQDKTHPGLMETLALALVDIARHEAAKKGVARLPSSPDAREAIALLTAAYNSTRAYPAVAARLRFLLGFAYVLTDDNDAAEAHLRAAYDHSPDNIEYTRHLAILLDERGQTSQAISILRAVVASDDAGRVAPALAYFLHERNEGDDRVQAIDALASILPRLDAVELPMRHELVDMLVSFLCEAQRFDEAERTASDHSLRMPQDVRFCLQAAIARRREHDSARSLALQASSSMTADTHVRDKRRIAIELTLSGAFKRALRVWKDIAPPGDALIDLPMIVGSAIAAGADHFLLRYLSKLRASGHRNEDAVHEEINLLCRYSAFRRARNIIQAEINREQDSSFAKALRVRLLQICHLRGLKCDENASPFSLPSVDEVDEKLVPGVVQVLAAYVSQHAAEDYAYEYLRRHFNSRHAHQAMILSVLFAKRGKARRDPKVVQVDTAVCYEDCQSGETSWVIIESGPNPEISRREYAPGHDLARKLLGRRLGEVVTTKDDAVTKRDVRISSIVSKYKYRFNVSMKAWENDFPKSKFLWQFNLKEDAEGQLDLAPILQSLKEQKKAVRVQEEFYRVNPLSVTTFAVLSRVTVLQAIQHLAESPELPIRCCRGGIEEWDTASAALQEGTAVVIDESALATMFLSDAYEILRSLQRPIYVLESTFVEFRKRLLEQMGSKVVGTMVEARGQPVLIEHARDVRKRHIARLADFLRTVRANAKIVDGLRFAELPRKRRKVLVGVLGRSGAETISFAAKKGMVLWTDDLMVADSFASSAESVGRFRCLTAVQAVFPGLFDGFGSHTISHSKTRLVPLARKARTPEAARRRKNGPTAENALKTPPFQLIHLPCITSENAPFHRRRTPTSAKAPTNSAEEPFF